MASELIQDRMIEPRAELIEDLRGLEGGILVVGAGGKLGPTLVQLARRAIEAGGGRQPVTAVSRFSDPSVAKLLQADGAEVISADVSDDAALAALPNAANVVYLLGTKFGTSGQEHRTWATNAYLAGRVANRYRDAQIVAMSTGNVYPFQPIVGGGATEVTPPDPVGEYAMSCLGRERIFAHFSDRFGTPISLVRLNYAVEMRYGVLVDIAKQIVAGSPVDVSAGQVNVVWQGYAAEATLRCLLHVDNPPFVLNVTGPESISIRRLAVRLAEAMDRPVTFTGVEGTTALLSDASKCHGMFGYPGVSLEALIEATARWIAAGGETSGKPTKFDRTDGRF